MNKGKNTKKNALLENGEAMNIIKTSSQNILETLLKESVKTYMENTIKEAEGDEEEESNDFEVEDAEVETPDEDVEITDTEETTDDGTEEVSDLEVGTEETPEEGEEGDVWGELDDFKVSDNEYDFTNTNDSDTVVKIWKLLGDDDAVSFNTDGNTVEITDNETGAQYKVEMPDNTGEELGGEDDSLEGDDSLEDEEPMFEMDLSKIGEILNEDFGYTDNYQNKDVMTNDGMAEPAHKNFTRSTDKGVPTGTEKPWAGDSKSKGDPFEETVNEGEETIEEITSITSNNARKVPKTHTSTVREPHIPYGSKHISSGGQYKENVKEAIIKKVNAVLAENAKIKKESDVVKQTLLQTRKWLNEAALVNVNLGKIVKILTENTTTKKEKVDIVNRFVKEANTFKQSEQLYESISRELQKGQTKKPVVLEKTLSTGSMINEKTVYQDPEIAKITDLMSRMAKTGL
jgi:hypothetical protein